MKFTKLLALSLVAGFSLLSVACSTGEPDVLDTEGEATESVEVDEDLDEIEEDEEAEDD